MRMLTGGVVDKGLKGYFMPVTLVDNPPEDSRIVLEERAYSSSCRWRLVGTSSSVVAHQRLGRSRRF